MTKSRAVTIKASRKPSGKFDFDMIEDGVVTELLVFNKSNDGLPKTDDYDIDFTLQNDPGVNLAFVTQQSKPGEPVIFIAKGTATTLPKCPKGPSTTPVGQFTVGNPTDTTLKVKNKDDDVCFYKFVLRFVDRDTGNIVEFDPIWGNQNGGGGGFQLISPATGTFLGGTAFGIVLTIVAYNVLPMMG